MPRASETQSRGFKYQRRSKENVRERANMRGGDFDSIIKQKYKVYKMRDGKNILRILPPTWEDPKHYGYDLYINYNVGVDNQSYLSLSKMKGEADPLAEAKREADREGNKKLSKDLSPRQRIAMWVLDRLEEDEGPQLWMAPFTLDKSIANLSFDEDTKEVIFIDDPDNGCDVRFYKEGVGLNTDYDASKIRILKAAPLHEDEGVQAEILEFVQENPIPECLQFYDYDHIAQVFDGHIGGQKPDEDETPKRPMRGETAKPRVQAQTNDEDDDPPFVPDKPKRTTLKIEPSDGDDSEDVADADSEDAAPKKTSLRERLQNRR